MTGGDLFPIISDAAQPAGKAVGNSLAEVWQAIVGDRVTAWRLGNAATINVKLQAKLAQSGSVLRRDALPDGVAFKWFEQATQADEPEIQDLFAQLLANAAQGNQDALRKRNIELISSLSPDDARLLSLIADRYAEASRKRGPREDVFRIAYDYIFARDYKEAGFESELPIDSLLSLGILRLDRDFSLDRHGLGNAIARATSPQMAGIYMGMPDVVGTSESLVLTEVGRSLLLALFPPTADIPSE